MNDVVSTFPLLRLPKKVILRTLRTMTHMEIFGISVLSKKTKNLVESLKLTAGAFPVFVTDVLDVHLYFPNNSWLYLELYRVLENQPLRELETPESLYIRSENARVRWTNLMSVHQLLDHLKLIFHSPITILYFSFNCDRFSFESIRKSVKDFQSICFPTGNHEQNRKVVDFFQPASLVLLEAALDDGHAPRDISIQNFDLIRTHSERVSLDNLLVNNSRSIVVQYDRFSVKKFNQFLKLLVKGSNPRLEFMSFEFLQNDLQDGELFKGLEYKHIPTNMRRLFKVSGEKEPQEIIGGCDIRRFDHTRITVAGRRSGNSIYFNTYVWHDHCVVYSINL